MRNGCSRIGAMMQIGSAKPCQTEAQGPASLVASHASRPLDTTSAVTNAATASRECLAGSKTGDASQPAMTPLIAASSDCRQWMSQSVPVSNRPRCNRHILVMSPEPNNFFAVTPALDRVRVTGSASIAVKQWREWGRSISLSVVLPFNLHFA